MQKRKAIPKKIEKSLWQEAKNMCVFCQNNDVSVLEIHHIEDWAATQDNSFENLILVCSNCHSKITDGSISQIKVMKAKLSLSFSKPESENKNNVVKFPSSRYVIDTGGGNINKSIVANKMNFPSRTSINLEAPEGTIGIDGNKKTYIKYLIDKFNEDFGPKDFRISNFHHSVIYTNIKKKFKCKWDLVPLEKFEELSDFIKLKIDKTTLGMGNPKKGRKNYSSYNEYLIKRHTKK